MITLWWCGDVSLFAHFDIMFGRGRMVDYSQRDITIKEEEDEFLILFSFHFYGSWHHCPQNFFVPCQDVEKAERTNRQCLVKDPQDHSKKSNKDRRNRSSWWIRTSRQFKGKLSGETSCDEGRTEVEQRKGSNLGEKATKIRRNKLI